MLRSILSLSLSWAGKGGRLLHIFISFPGLGAAYVIFLHIMGRVKLCKIRNECARRKKKIKIKIKIKLLYRRSWKEEGERSIWVDKDWKLDIKYTSSFSWSSSINHGPVLLSWSPSLHLPLQSSTYLSIYPYVWSTFLHQTGQISRNPPLPAQAFFFFFFFSFSHPHLPHTSSKVLATR